ncbi:hypothetical protein GCM10022246_36170 [Pedobacter ginsengiterrae]|uniref:Uncharacterized protein n=2 Tax=Pedobacter TaxID=84567 RepID=A0ABP7QDL7_9SPHI
MNLQENIINFYEMSRELESIKSKIKQLRQGLGTNENEQMFDIQALQKKVDCYVEIESLVNKMTLIPGKLLGIQNRIIFLLKQVGFPERHKILVNMENQEALNFWYDGSDVFSEEVASPIHV